MDAYLSLIITLGIACLLLAGLVIFLVCRYFRLEERHRQCRHELRRQIATPARLPMRGRPAAPPPRPADAPPPPAPRK